MAHQLSVLEIEANKLLSRKGFTRNGAPKPKGTSGASQDFFERSLVVQPVGAGRRRR